jgi:hypothetical protein
MDLERTLNVFTDIKIDEDKLKIDSFLTELLSLAKDIIASEKSDKTLNDKLIELPKKISSSLFNNNSYSNYKILEELEGSEFFGEALVFKVQNIFSRNLSPAQILKDLEAFKKNREKFIEISKRITSDFKELKIQPYYLSDEFELGIIIPSDETFDNLKSFEKVIHDWNFILKCFNEIVNKDNSEIKLSGIADGSYELFINQTFELAHCLMKVIGSITALHVALKQLRTHYMEVKKANVLKDKLPSFEEIKKEKINDEIESIKKEIIVKYGTNLEDGRKAELTIGLDKSVRLMIKNLNNGIILEVTPPYIGNPEEITASDSEEEKARKLKENETHKNLSKQVNIINKSAGILKSAIELSKSEFKLLNQKSSDDQDPDDVQEDDGQEDDLGIDEDQNENE